MNLMALPWTALMDMQPQRSHQIAWFVYGWIEREHVLNVTACADWWTRALGLSAAQLKVPSQIKGAVIVSLDEDSVAYDAGLRQGDVILEINRQPVKNADQATALCAKPESKVSLVKVWSRGGTRFIVVDESKAG